MGEEASGEEEERGGERRRREMELRVRYVIP